MSQFLVTEVLNVVAVGVDGDGGEVNTSAFPVLDKNLRPQAEKSQLNSFDALLTISATAHTGTSMLVSVIQVIDGVDHEIGIFTALTGVGVETIRILNCPEKIKIKYVETAMTVWTAKVFCSRF